MNVFSHEGQGESFPSTVELDGREITCDDEVLPREQCCIARRKHLTCYSIMFVLSHIPPSLHVAVYVQCNTGKTWYISGWTVSFSALKSKAISRRISLVCAKQCWNQLVARKEGCQRYRNIFLNSLSWRHCVYIHVLFFHKGQHGKVPGRQLGLSRSQNTILETLRKQRRLRARFSMLIHRLINKILLWERTSYTIKT